MSIGIFKRGFLDPEPPRDESDLVVALFEGRELELEILEEELAPEIEHDKIYPIYGPSRVGKSHLLERVFIEMKNKHDRKIHLVRVLAKSKTAQEVLWEVLDVIYREIYSVCEGIDDVDGDDDLKKLIEIGKSKYEMYYALRISKENTATYSTTLKKEESTKKYLKATLGTKLSAKVLRFLSGEMSGELSLERSGTAATHREDGISYICHQPSLEGLAILAELLATILVSAIKGQRMYLFIDDVDLLENVNSFGGESVELVRRLGYLAMIKGVTVVVTTRQHLIYPRKDIFRRTDPILPFGDDFSISNIYERHVRLLGNSHNILTDSAKEKLIELSQRRPGLFLERAWDLKRLYRQRERPLNLREIREFFRDRLSDCNGNAYDVKLLNLLKDKANKNQTSVGSEELKSRDLSFDQLQKCSLVDRSFYVTSHEGSLEINAYDIWALQDENGISVTI